MRQKYFTHGEVSPAGCLQNYLLLMIIDSKITLENEGLMKIG